MPNSLDTITFTSHGNALLGTFFRAAGDGPRPTALLMHGIPGAEKNVDLAYALRDAGWNALLFHYRGCWGSAGVYSLAGILDDITAALDYLQQDATVDRERLVGIGLSLGGWGVVMAAASDTRLRAVVTINPVVTPLTAPLADDRAAGFAVMLTGISGAEVQAQYNALTPLPAVAGQLGGRPVLLITGEADTLFTVEHQRTLAEAMPFATWQRIPEAGHTFDDHRAVLVHTVVDWLTRTFSPLPALPAGLALRHSTDADHLRVLAVLSPWWGGRDLGHLLPRLFFQHFNDTSFIVEHDGELVAFLIGFVSQSEPGVAYIHFVGVHPEQRKAGLGRALYERFFELARAHGVHEVQCITSPVNTGSIAYHTRMGFKMSAPVENYDAAGEARVKFKKMV